LLFQEEIGLGLSNGENAAAKFSANFGSLEDPVMFVDSICSEVEGGLPDLLSVQKRGQITCFASGLDDTVWTSEIPQAHNGSDQYVEYVSIQEASSAKQGFLRNRPDLLAMLAPSHAAKTADDDLVNVLVLVTRIAKVEGTAATDRTVHILSIRPHLSGSSRRNPVQPIISWPLPSGSVSPASDEALQYSFGKKTGLLQQLSSGSIHTYDLSGPAPVLLSSMDQPEEAITSFVPVSSAIILTSSKTHCGVWDVRYRSLQALQTAAIQHEPMTRQKRKQSLTEATDSQLTFLDFFSSLDIAIALAGTQLVGVQVRSSTRRKTDKARLVDCLGKSIVSNRKTESDGTTKSAGFLNWETHLAELDSAAVRGHGKDFDSAFASAMSVTSKDTAQKPECLEMGSGFHPFELHQAVLYALGKIFAWTSTSSKTLHSRQSSIRMVFRPKRTFAWLDMEGYLSPSNVENALRRHRSLTNSQANVSSKDMIVAFTNFEPQLELLCKFMDVSRLDLDGAMEAVKVLLQSFNAPSNLSNDRLLTNGTNGVTDTEVQAEDEAAEKDLTFAASLLNGDSDVRGNALQQVLEHLARSFPPLKLAQSLRSQLSRHDISLLIELLRVALSEGGWTSRYLDFYPSEIEGSIANQNDVLFPICTLLNCALDALGTGGWLGGSTDDADDNAGSLLTQLRVETSAVLEGVQESTFFAGFLKDFVRYEKLAKESTASARKPHDRKVTASSQQEGGISVLPLGVKAAEKIATIRVGAGGEVKKRSQRDIGQSISEKIGKYTFETIRV